MGHQSRHGCSTGMICTQNLAEKDPQCDQRRIDSVQPADTECFQCLRDKLRGQDVAQWQLFILQKLMPQKVDLLLKSSVTRMPHLNGLLAGDGFVGKQPSRRARPFCLCRFNVRIYDELRAIRHIDEWHLIPAKAFDHL
jgi:hypothetical protein